jgi:hypothetical protein
VGGGNGVVYAGVDRAAAAARASSAVSLAASSRDLDPAQVGSPELAPALARSANAFSTPDRIVPLAGEHGPPGVVSAA